MNLCVGSAGRRSGAAGGSGTEKVKLSEIADISNDRALETIVLTNRKDHTVTSEVKKDKK
jgi:hypothetical protein